MQHGARPTRTNGSPGRSASRAARRPGGPGLRTRAEGRAARACCCVYADDSEDGEQRARLGRRKTGPEVIDSDGMQATRCSELRMIADIAPLCERTLQ